MTRTLRTLTGTIAVVTEAVNDQDDIDSPTEKKPGVVL